MRAKQGWRWLPFQGEVSELVIVGNGKDCTLRVRVPDGRGFGIPISSYGDGVIINCCDGVVVSTTGPDDVSLMIRYTPQPGWRMSVARARVNYLGSDEDWAGDCAVWQHMTRDPLPPESWWAIGDLEIDLTAWRDPLPYAGRHKPAAAMAERLSEASRQSIEVASDRTAQRHE
ncbi:MAG: hypothetical protein ACOY0T_21670 [Myxococcota bacterium]